MNINVHRRTSKHERVKVLALYLRLVAKTKKMTYLLSPCQSKLHTLQVSLLKSINNTFQALNTHNGGLGLDLGFPLAVMMMREARNDP